MNRVIAAFLLLLVLVSTASAQDRKPLIGVEADLVRDAKTGELKAHVAEAYLQAVRDAGGEPVILSPLSTTVDAALEKVHGVVMTGGDDVPSERYGEKRLTDAKTVEPERQKFAEELITKALERGVPLLGICLGHQLLNVVRGGKLIQDIPTLVKDAAKHRRADTHEAGETRHPIEVKKGSRLAETTGETLEVNSFHHQAVRLVGQGLRAVARAADGVVEAVESWNPKRFVFGVQWHPEREAKGSPGRAVFDRLVEASTAYQSSREQAARTRVRAQSSGFNRLLDRVEGGRQRAVRR